MFAQFVQIFLILFVLNPGKIIFSQPSFFNITQVEEGCTSFIFTTGFFPEQPFNFTWKIKIESSTFLLANVSLAESGKITSEKLTNSFLHFTDYDVLHPPKVEFLQQPFEVKLSLRNYKPIQQITVEIELTSQANGMDISQSQGVNVSALSCSFQRDNYCVENCLNESYCETNFTKVCEDGRLLVQDCPADVRTVEFAQCRYQLGILSGGHSISVFYALCGVGIGLLLMAGMLTYIGYKNGYFTDSEEYFDIKYRFGATILILFGFALFFTGFGMIYGLPSKKGSLGIFLIITGCAMLIFAIFAGSYIITWHRRLSQALASSSRDLRGLRTSTRYPLVEYLPPYFN